MAQLTQPLKWHGGKYYLRKWIVGLMPPHLHYVEPFFGGGGILLARDPNRDWMATGAEKLPAALKGSSEVVNDLHGELINFWRVLQDAAHFDSFRQRMEMTPFSEAEFDRAFEFSQTGEADRDATDVERAVQFFILARQSRQGLMRDFATLSRNRTRSRINEQASAWLNVVEGLPDVHRRLRGVVILNQKATDVIRKQDGLNTLFCCDPPYVHASRSTTGEYAFEMGEVEHEDCWRRYRSSKASSCSVVIRAASTRSGNRSTIGPGTRLRSTTKLLPARSRKRRQSVCGAISDRLPSFHFAEIDRGFRHLFSQLDDLRHNDQNSRIELCNQALSGWKK
ncbi:MAG: DNA adenine methylase [Pirellulaceae bacterium]